MANYFTDKGLRMIVAGCDVGSLTAEAVIMKDNSIIASSIIRVKSTALKSATAVMELTLKKAGLGFNDLNLCCSTGYGRYNIPFATINMSEISCHGTGAYWLDSSIRTIIDIGGQDCKIILIDRNGMVKDFIMNDKCAAGTGRSLEILSKAIGLKLEQLGPVSLKSWRPVEITNKCSIFMELEVLHHLYRKKKIKDIACGINDAVAKRVASLTRSLDIKEDITITGGVSKNVGVVKILSYLIDMNFKPLSADPQLVGAIGAAVFAMKEAEKMKDSELVL